MDAEEYLVADLIGCDVREGSRCFGKVRDVINAGASDILVIGEGKGERLVPFVDDWVGSVDLVGRTVELRGSDEWDLIAIAE